MQDPVTFLLSFVAVYAHGRPSITAHTARDFIHFPFSFSEYNRLQKFITRRLVVNSMPLSISYSISNLQLSSKEITSRE